MTKITSDAEAMSVLEDLRWIARANMTITDQKRFRAARDHIAARLASTSPAPDVVVSFVSDGKANRELVTALNVALIPFYGERVFVDDTREAIARTLIRYAAPQPVVEKDND